MKLIPGSHLGGIIKHRKSEETDSVLTLELEDGSDFRDTRIQHVWTSQEGGNVFAVVVIQEGETRGFNLWLQVMIGMS